MPLSLCLDWCTRWDVLDLIAGILAQSRMVTIEDLDVVSSGDATAMLYRHLSCVLYKQIDPS